MRRRTFSLTFLGYVFGTFEWTEDCDCSPEPPRLMANGGGQFEISPFGFAMSADQLADRVERAELRRGFDGMGWG